MASQGLRTFPMSDPAPMGILKSYHNAETFDRINETVKDVDPGSLMLLLPSFLVFLRVAKNSKQ